MGLGVTGYSHVRRDKHQYDRARCLEEGLIDGWNTADFKKRLPGGNGCFRKTAATEEIEVDCGGYTFYNHWRDRLSRAVLGVSAKQVWAQEKKFKDKPFFELIAFADNEGAIGAPASGRLYRAFVKYRQMALDAEFDSEFVEVYDGLTHAFELGAQGGIVIFH